MQTACIVNNNTEKYYLIKPYIKNNCIASIMMFLNLYHTSICLYKPKSVIFAFITMYTRLSII